MGTSENVLGSFLRTIPRDSFQISAKFTPQCASMFQGNPVISMFEKSAELLGVDFIDYYWIYNPTDAPMGKRINTISQKRENR